jgi:hypothetical protein
VQRVDEAVAAAKAQYDSYLRSFVTPHIGPDKAFKSMEEFEACRFVRGGNLRPDQVDALKTIRNSVIALAIRARCGRLPFGSFLNYQRLLPSNYRSCNRTFLATIRVKSSGN